MNISNLMNITVTHQRKDRTSDGQGGRSFTFSDMPTSTYSARLSQPSAGLRQMTNQGQDVAEISHELYISPVPVAGTFRTGDRIVYGSRNFEVKIPNVQPSKTVYQRLGLLELQNPS